MNEKTSNDYDKYFLPKNPSKIYIPQKIYIAQEDPRMVNNSAKLNRIVDMLYLTQLDN